MPSQIRRKAPVPTLPSASSTRPAIMSPSSHCMRSISNGFMRTVWRRERAAGVVLRLCLDDGLEVLALRGHGPRQYPRVEDARGVDRGLGGAQRRGERIRALARRTRGGGRARQRGGG